MKILGVFLAGLGIATFVVLLMGLPLMLLWNWLMPTLFHLARIGFWQAVGLGLLSHILFKNSTSTSKS